MRCSYSPTTTTSVGSWRRRVWAPDKSAGPRNSLATTSESTIVRARLTGLLMPCLDTLNEVQRRKKPSAPRTSKSCTVCSPPCPMQASQASTPQPMSCRHSTECSSAARMSYLNYVSFGTRSEPNWVQRALTKSASVPWGYDSPSCRKTTTKQSFSEALRTFRRAGRTSRECSSTKGSHTSQRLSVPRS